MQAKLALYRQLQKSFKTIDIQFKAWEEEHLITVQNLASLGNISQQLQSCEKVNLKSTPLEDFVDLKACLRCKLLHEMDQKMPALRDSVSSLREVSSRISRQQKCVMDLYGRYAQQISVEEMCQGEPLWPSIADMLHWLRDIDEQIFALYQEKDHLLKSIDYSSEEKMQHLDKNWAKLGTLPQHLQDVNAFLQFFMVEKF